MANPVCLSPLKFYDSIAKQCHRKSYAFGSISPLLCKLHILSAFQFVLPSNTMLSAVYVYNINDNAVTGNVLSAFTEAGLAINQVNGFNVVSFPGSLPVLSTLNEGEYYLKIVFSDSSVYYSEIFCFDNTASRYLEIEYWNTEGNLFIKNGVISFDNGFHFSILLNTEIGKPEYTFEEEITKRLGYNFVESQVSKKTFKFNTVIPEYLCDAMRIIRMCDNKIITSKNDEYDAITFDMTVDWQNQGDLASATCEFETDNVVTNLGSFRV